MEFSKKGTMDPMNGLKSVNGIQFSLCGTPTNLIFAHRVSRQFVSSLSNFSKCLISLSNHPDCPYGGPKC